MAESDRGVYLSVSILCSADLRDLGIGYLRAHFHWVCDGQRGCFYRLQREYLLLSLNLMRALVMPFYGIPDHRMAEDNTSNTRAI